MANENDQDFQGSLGQGGPSFNEGEEQVESGLTAVASSSKKAIVGLVLIAAILGIIIYTVFSGGSEEPEQKPDEVAEDLTNIAGSGGAIAPPAVIAPPPPPPPPPAVVAPAAPVVDNTLIPPPPPPPGVEAGTPSQEAKNARMKSAMLVLSGTASPSVTSQPQAADASIPQDPNLAFAQNAIRSSETDAVEAKQVGNLNRTIVQGKIINAVLETAINTDLPGTIRAIVSRDVYPEAGRSVLFPKGSRLLGAYKSDSIFGQKRLYIIWTRVVRPDGVDIAIGSPAVDNLGRTGLEASFVDNKFLEMFTAAALTSTITIGTAIAAESMIDDPTVTTTTGSDGGSTTKSSAATEGTTEAIENIADISKTIVDKYVRLNPTMYVDQGTLVNVFVARDLVFPENVINGNRFIQ